MTSRLTRTVAALVLALTAAACSNDETTLPDPVPPKGGTQSPGDHLDGEGDGNGDENGDGGENGNATISGETEHRITETGPASVTCDNGGEIYVEAAAEVTVTGDCWDIDVRADGAVLDAEQARDLDVDGNDNDITVDAVRELDISGDGNTVAMVTVREIDVEGSDNTITYDEGSPEIDDEGSGNNISSQG